MRYPCHYFPSYLSGSAGPEYMSEAIIVSANECSGLAKCCHKITEAPVRVASIRAVALLHVCRGDFPPGPVELPFESKVGLLASGCVSVEAAKARRPGNFAGLTDTNSFLERAHP